MVTMELDGVKVEGDSIKTALREARKVERAQARARELKTARREKARMVAGYNVATVLHLADCNMSALWPMTPDHQFWKHYITPGSDAEATCGATPFRLRTGQTFFVTCGYTPVNIIVDVQDRLLAVCLQDTYGGKVNGEREWYGIGEWEGETDLFRFPKSFDGIATRE